MCVYEWCVHEKQNCLSCLIEETASQSNENLKKKKRPCSQSLKHTHQCNSFQFGNQICSNNQKAPENLKRQLLRHFNWPKLHRLLWSSWERIFLIIIWLFSWGIIYFLLLEYFLPLLSLPPYPIFASVIYKANVKQSYYTLPSSFALRLEWTIFFFTWYFWEICWRRCVPSSSHLLLIIVLSFSPLHIVCSSFFPTSLITRLFHIVLVSQHQDFLL